MKDIEDVPLVPVQNVFAAKHVSPKKGDQVYGQLKTDGKITPTETTTKRRLLSIRDTRTLAGAL